jgi:hypothetical protein
MHSTGDKDNLFCFFDPEVGDGQKFNVIASWRFSEGSSLEDVCIFRLVVYFQKISIEHSEGIGLAVCEIDGFVLFFEIVGEREGKMRLQFSNFDIVLHVCYLGAVPCPGISVALGTHQYLHPVFVRRVILEEIEKVEFDSASCRSVLYPEEKPLGASRAVDVLLEEQIVLLMF